MKKLKSSAMLVVAVLCGYLALMTPDWKSQVVASMNPGYQSNYTGDHIAGVYWQGQPGYSTNTNNEIWELTFPLYSTNWGIPSRFYPPLFAAQDSWSIVGNGDYDNNASSDVIWRNKTTGAWKVWLLTGGVRTAQTNNTTFDTAMAYTMIGSGDVNGDGTDDLILFNSSTGEIGTYTMVGGNMTTYTVLGTVDAGYTPVRVGDFNGDGYVDIMIQNGTSLKIWQIVNNAYVAEQPGFGTGANYTTVCAADFDGDGTSDLYLQSTDGLYTEKWAKVVNFARTAQYVGASNTGFTFLACGDFDGNGAADVWWQRQSDDQQRIVFQSGFGATKTTVYTNAYGGPAPTDPAQGYRWAGSHN